MTIGIRASTRAEDASWAGVHGIRPIAPGRVVACHRAADVLAGQDAADAIRATFIAVTMRVEEPRTPGPIDLGSGRLEAFSDAVMAVIITILALELRPPGGPRLDALRKECPAC